MQRHPVEEFGWNLMDVLRFEDVWHVSLARNCCKNRNLLKSLLLKCPFYFLIGFRTYPASLARFAGNGKLLLSYLGRMQSRILLAAGSKTEKLSGGRRQDRVVRSGKKRKSARKNIENCLQIKCK